jgi:mRNA interferase MazF
MKSGDRQCPDAGDFIWIGLDPVVGHEQGGHRPALVLSRFKYNERAELCVACPITSHSKGYPFEVAIPDGCPVQGVVLVDQLRSISWSGRGVTVVGKAPPNLLDDVREKLATLLEV